MHTQQKKIAAVGCDNEIHVRECMFQVEVCFVLRPLIIKLVRGFTVWWILKAEGCKKCYLKLFYIGNTTIYTRSFRELVVYTASKVLCLLVSCRFLLPEKIYISAMKTFLASSFNQGGKHCWLGTCNCIECMTVWTCKSKSTVHNFLYSKMFYMWPDGIGNWCSKTCFGVDIKG